MRATMAGMSVTIALISHPPIASALLKVAEHLMGTAMPAIDCFEVPFDEAAETLDQRLSQALPSSGPLLLLTDLYGASPSNAAARLAARRADTRRVAGLSLPMLLRVLNYANRELDELVRIAVSGGCGAVVTDDA